MSGTVREYKILSETYEEGRLRTQWAGALASATQGERCAIQMSQVPLIWKWAGNLTEGEIPIDFVLRYNETTVQVYKVELEGSLEGGLLSRPRLNDRSLRGSEHNQKVSSCSG